MNATIAIRTPAGRPATVTVVSVPLNGGTSTTFSTDAATKGNTHSIWSNGTKAEIDKRIRAHLKGFIAVYGTRVRNTGKTKPVEAPKPVEQLTNQELYDELVELGDQPSPASAKPLTTIPPKAAAPKAAPARRPILRETFSIARTGEFTVILSGTTHCSLAGPFERTLKFEVFCRMAGSHGLDDQGFIIDNVDIQKRFDAVKICEVSCELLCRQMADLIIEDLGDRAITLREIKVRVWGVPGVAFAEYRAEA